MAAPPKEFVLVPKALRKVHSVRLSLDVVSTPSRFRTLKNEWKASASRTGIAVTTPGDLETAIDIHETEDEGHLHALIDYRRERVAPYARVSRTRLKELIAFIDSSSRITLRNFQQTVSAPETEILKAFQERGLSFRGRPARVTAFDVELVDGTGGLALRLKPERLMMTWATGSAVASVADAYIKGPELLRNALGRKTDE